MRPDSGIPRKAFRTLLAALVAVAGMMALPLLAQEETAEAPEMGFEISDERPVRGETVRLTVTRGPGPAPGARVTAIYRPNSTTSVTEDLPTVDASGTILWTPAHTGPVTLEARPANAAEDAAAATSHTIAVRYGSMPLSGLLIMVLAGLLLFGGGAAGLVLLLKAPEHAPAAEPPST